MLLKQQQQQLEKNVNENVNEITDNNENGETVGINTESELSEYTIEDESMTDVYELTVADANSNGRVNDDDYLKELLDAEPGDFLEEDNNDKKWLKSRRKKTKMNKRRTSIKGRVKQNIKVWSLTTTGGEVSPNHTIIIIFFFLTLYTSSNILNKSHIYPLKTLLSLD